MFKNSAQLIQAVPLIEGKVNMLAGDDRAFSGEITVLAGCTVTID